MFDDKTDILVAGRALDKKVLETCGEGDLGASPRDCLFDILMERFDILSADCEAILSILKLCAGPKASGDQPAASRAVMA